MRFFLVFSLLLIIRCENGTKVENHIKPVKSELETRLEYYYERDLYGRVIGVVDSLIYMDSLNGSYYYKKAISYAFFQLYDSSNFYFLKSASLKYREKDSYYSVGMRFHFDLNDTLCLFYLKKSLQIDPSDTMIIRKINEIEMGLPLKTKKNIEIVI